MYLFGLKYSQKKNQKKMAGKDPTNPLPHLLKKQYLLFKFSQKGPARIFPKLFKYQLLSQIFIWHRWHLQNIFLD